MLKEIADHFNVVALHRGAGLSFLHLAFPPFFHRSVAVVGEHSLPHRAVLRSVMTGGELARHADNLAAQPEHDDAVNTNASEGVSEAFARQPLLHEVVLSSSTLRSRGLKQKHICKFVDVKMREKRSATDEVE